MLLPREIVNKSFKIILGRDVSCLSDDEPGIIAHRELESREKLVEILINSQEYLEKSRIDAIAALNSKETKDEKKEIRILQTHDPVKYKKLADITWGTIEKYCNLHKLSCEKYIGIKKGKYPWHACFNRIFILREMIDRGVSGWVLYMDADSWINDFEFNICEYLKDKEEYTAIFSKSDNVWWAVNNGVFLINLDNPKTSLLIDVWLKELESNWIKIKNQPNFISLHDQALLHFILNKNYFREDDFYFESYNLINSSFASFIKIALLAGHPNMDDRIKAVDSQIKLNI